jgi:hypothetical protein
MFVSSQPEHAAMKLETASTGPPCRRFELRFESLFHPGRGLTFPCDEGGHVLMDALSEPARRNYLYARAVVGREYAVPAVRGTLNG